MPRPEGPLGPGEDILVEFASDLRKLREQGGSPTYRELTRRAGYSVTTLAEAAGGRKLPSLPVVMAYVGACGGDTAEWKQRWQEVAAGLDARRNGAADDPVTDQPPYVGLAAFQRSDADRFFGRRRLVGELLDLLAERRFVTVFGASGAGKSSLLRAGLAGKDHDGWLVKVFTPGRHPLKEFAACMTETSPGTELVLVVDQFEETFTLCQDVQEREQFITALVSCAHADESQVRVVLGVRAHFLAYCLEYPELTAALHDSQVLVGPMTTEELRQATIQPAVKAGCIVEGALMVTIVSEVAGRTGVLPLFSHALFETWRRRRGNTLTLSGYQAAGGIQGAVTQTAESLYATFTPRQQRVVKDLLLRLTVLGEGTEDTKRRINRTELRLDDPDVQTVLDILTTARLVTVDANMIEITHEALIGAWPRLRRWLTDDRESLRTSRQLTEAAHSWVSLSATPARFTGVRGSHSRGNGWRRRSTPTSSTPPNVLFWTRVSTLSATNTRPPCAATGCCVRSPSV